MCSHTQLTGTGLSSINTLRRRSPSPGDGPFASFVVGVDVSQEMLCTARREQGRAARLELVQCDLGQGLPFRSRVFDASVSIGVVSQPLRQEARGGCTPPLFVFLFSCSPNKYS